jgi:hypothetical protein
MALSPDDKFIYINPDTTPGEYNTAHYFPVKYFRGLETVAVSSTLVYIYFRGPKNTYSTRIQISITDGFVKEFFTQFVDEVNFGEASVITLADRNIAVDSTTGGTDFQHVNAYVIPVLMSDSNTAGYEDVQVAEDLDIGGSLKLDNVALSAVQKSTESFADNDTSLMTSAAIDDRINAAGGSVSVSDSTADTDFPIVFHDESNNLHDDTGALTYNPSTSLLKAPGVVIVATGIELGHASDTTIARSAAGIITVEGKQVFTTNTPTLTSAAAGVPAVTMQARRTITTAEANSMHTTPIEIVPAQGANTVIVPSGGMIRIDRAATQNASAADWNMHYAGEEPGAVNSASVHHVRRFMYGETGDRVFHIIPGLYYNEVNQDLTTDVNAALEVSFDSATTTDCFTRIEVYLTYQVFNIA